jgi:hypothetical protein
MLTLLLLNPGLSANNLLPLGAHPYAQNLLSSMPDSSINTKSSFFIFAMKFCVYLYPFPGRENFLCV